MKIIKPAKKAKKPQIVEPLLTYDGEYIPLFRITDRRSGSSIMLTADETKDLYEQLRIIYICERAKNSVEVKKIEREKGIVTAKRVKAK